MMKNNKSMVGVGGLSLQVCLVLMFVVEFFIPFMAGALFAGQANWWSTKFFRTTPEIIQFLTFLLLLTLWVYAGHFSDWLGAAIQKRSALKSNSNAEEK